MRPDILSVVEAAYRVTLAEDEWIDGVLESAAPALPAGAGAFAYLFDAQGAKVRVLNFRSLPRTIALEQAMTTIVESAPREYIERTCFGFASDIPGSVEILEASRAPFRDILAVNGFDPSGRGFWLGAPLAKRRSATPEVATRWLRVAAHLGASYRLRRALDAPKNVAVGAQAVLDPNGNVLHAETDACAPEDWAVLRAAVKRLDRVRSSKGGTPDERLFSWKGLVNARWSLVDHFDSDGKRFVVARSNEPNRDETATLSARERQVLACLAIGHSTRTVAYELGLADATVRVLVLRAVRKLGAGSRQEAIAKFVALGAPSAGTSSQTNAAKARLKARKRE